MIEFRNVVKSYDENIVVNDQSFTIDDGEFFVLVGPSGSGKTTTLKMINRLVKETSGDIIINGKNIDDYDLRELRLNTGYVLQQIALFPNMTVGENIELIPEMKKWPKKKRSKIARDLLDRVGLSNEIYYKRLPSDLSGGEQQRVGILRAIIARPEILLMDEPFSALDPIYRTQLQDLIKDIHKDLGISIVFVTHDMSEALRLGDRICIMKDGCIVQIGTPQEIMSSPADKFVEEFFSSGVMDIE